ncbi:MAG: D-glycero-alpha-D-manno-heptose-1,7-bisphosphate 7-phosphatase [Planctomycetota bacterium]|jgi:D,D-heptose 1,7-bisphosphate phosphatase
MPNKAVFVDRDNTLIEDPGYLADPDAVRLLPGVEVAIKSFMDAGYFIVVVTNQSGVARGLLTEGALRTIHQNMVDLLARKGARIDEIYYCPYHAEGTVAEYAVDSDLRKPNPGMLLQAAEDMDIDLEASWMIGDSARDVEAGQRAGCRTIRVRPPHEDDANDDLEEDFQADYTVRNLVEAARVISQVDDEEGEQTPEIGIVAASVNGGEQAVFDVDEERGAAETARPADPLYEQLSESPVDDTEEPADDAEPQEVLYRAPGPPPFEPPEAPDLPDLPELTPLEPMPEAAEAEAPTEEHADEESVEEPEEEGEERADDSANQLRREILQQVRQMAHQQREASDEFSVWRLAGTILQVFVFVTLAVAAYHLRGTGDHLSRAQAWATITVALQLMALTLTLTQRRR